MIVIEIKIATETVGATLNETVIATSTVTETETSKSIATAT